MHVPGNLSSAGAEQGARQLRLVRAAHEFEAQMMKELLKPLSAAPGSDQEDSDTGATGVLGQFASEALGKALSEQGGLGIANSILQHFSQDGNSSGPAKVTGNLHKNTASTRLNG